MLYTVWAKFMTSMGVCVCVCEIDVCRRLVNLLTQSSVVGVHDKVCVVAKTFPILEGHFVLLPGIIGKLF